tara:strand:+ start:260 stop:403 length:144 start_codon:yes stop_codon:yes gene_type:complete
MLFNRALDIKESRMTPEKLTLHCNKRTMKRFTYEHIINLRYGKKEKR